jgi:hypothetical protein
VHPIERLRYVARASGAGQADLVRETASALASLGFDPPGLLTACRRILQRHPASAPLWWLSARVLTAGDPVAEAWQAADELDADPTARQLSSALPDDATVCVLGWPELVGDALVPRGDVTVLVVDVHDEGSGFARRLAMSEVDATDVPLAGLGAAASNCDLVLLEASGIGPDAFVSIAGSRAAAAVGRHSGAGVWLVGGVGRLLPARMWEALSGRVDDGTYDLWELDDEIVPLDLVDRVVGPWGMVPVADALRHVDCPVAPELLRAAG